MLALDRRSAWGFRSKSAQRYTAIYWGEFLRIPHMWGAKIWVDFLENSLNPWVDFLTPNIWEAALDQPPG